MEQKKFGIHFGAMSDPISKQLKAQKLKFDVETVKHFQKDIDAIIRVRIRGILGDSIYVKAQDKLFKNITKHIQKLNS